MNERCPECGHPRDDHDAAGCWHEFDRLEGDDYVTSFCDCSMKDWGMVRFRNALGGIRIAARLRLRGEVRVTNFKISEDL